MVDSGLDEYILDRFSSRSNATFALSMIKIDWPNTCRKVIDPVKAFSIACRYVNRIITARTKSSTQLTIAQPWG